MKKFLLVVLAVAIAMTSVFSSCGNGGKGKTTKTDPPLDPSKTISVFWKNNDTEKAVIYDSWMAFKSECQTEGTELNSKYGNRIGSMNYINPVDSLGYSKAQLDTLILGGSAPDIIKMDHVYIAEYGKTNTIYDLSKDPYNANNIKEQFNASCWKASCAGDAVYGLPFDANTVIFGAHKQYLDNAGVKLPTTFQELLDVGNVLSTQPLPVSIYAMPCGNTTTNPTKLNWTVFVWLFYVWRLGGDVLNADNTEAIFNKPDTGVKAFEMIKQLRDSGMIKLDGYEENDAVMSDMGTWRVDGFKDEMAFGLQPELKPGVPRYSGLGLYTLSLMKSSPNPDMAYDYMKYLAMGQSLTTTHTEADGSVAANYFQYDYAKALNLIPSLKVAASATRSLDTKVQTFWDVCNQQMDLTKARPMVAQWKDIEVELFNAITEVLVNGKDPTEVLNTSAAAVNAMLKKS